MYFHCHQNFIPLGNHPEIIITGLLLAGASFAIAVYHLFLFRQYRERILVAYSFYLILVFTYTILSTVHLLTHTGNLQTYLIWLKEAISMLTIVTYCWFLMEALSAFWVSHSQFFRFLKMAMMAGTVYALLFGMLAFIKPAEDYGQFGILRITVRCLFFIVAIYAAWTFFPKMNDPFLRLIRLGTVVYMGITGLIMLSVAMKREWLWGLMDMHWFYIGAFVDIFIFSLAMAFKVKLLMLRVLEVRQEISRDLHDDIGASLSSLQIYGTIAEKTYRENPEKAMEVIRKISAQSQKVMDDMGDIVWSMKPGGDRAASLETRIKNFGAELLQDKNIQFVYAIAPETDLVFKELQHRRNLLLIIKEAMNNIAKYSQAANAALKLQVNGSIVSLDITDDGRGFDTQVPQNGNGLSNMRSRVKEMQGDFALHSGAGKGTRINIRLPLTNTPGW